ncbi:hypothetical protein [Cytobacillus stercorigallinarum]|nr:hypothetical protein [Cytobacillus stercorigallinarum]
MFNLKSLKKSPIQTYAVACYTDESLSRETHDNQIAYPLADLDNVNLTVEILDAEWNDLQRATLHEIMNEKELQFPFFIINEIHAEDIKKGIKRYKKEHPFKNLFGTISFEEILDVESRAIFQLHEAVAYKQTVAETIEFLNGKLAGQKSS